jgi:RecJ-like exonuclease
MRDTLKALINEPAGFHVNSKLVATDRYMVKGFEEIRTELIDDGKPYAVCIGCNGTGKVRIDNCKSCKGCGWLTKYKWKQIKSTTEGEALIK